MAAPLQAEPTQSGSEVEHAGGAPNIPILDDRPFTPDTLWEPPRHEWAVRLGVLAVAASLFLPFLGSFGLWDPWETHYGAVTTNMVETQDWVSPWWGYKEKIGSEPQQGKPFFSKPVFIFWSEATAVKVFGRSELAIRLPMALLAIFAVFFVFWGCSRIWGRRVGLLAALVLATAPQFYMISRQAQTDMPFVGTLIICLIFLMVALFGPRRRMSNRRFWIWTGATLAFLLINTLPQYQIIRLDLGPDPPANAGMLWHLGHDPGTRQVIGWLVLLLAAIAMFAFDLVRSIKREGLTDQLKDKWLRRWCLVIAYIMAAQSMYAKGLLGLALPGLIALCYLMLSWRWALLKRAIIVRGLMVFVAVGFPWYWAMFSKHGMAYYQRWIVHDHLKRVGAGVHAIDSGNFEHFIKWLGLGMFPWIAFVPVALILLLRVNPWDWRRRSQATLFVATWFVAAFTFFTISSTKFHHYIFPVLPALAIIVALAIDKLLDARTWLPRATALVGVVFVGAMTWDLHQEPQHIRNLMTYKYDRPMPSHLPLSADGYVSKNNDAVWADSTFFKHTSTELQSVLTTEGFEYQTWITFIGILGILALGLFCLWRTRRAGIALLGLAALMMTSWSLSYYMPSLAPHWSQKYLFESYYDRCTPTRNVDAVQLAYQPLLVDMGLEDLAEWTGYHNKRVCREDVISWLITWRGETYYSYNELQPVTKEKPQFKPYLENRNNGERFFALIERGKMSNLKSKLNTHSTALAKQLRDERKQPAPDAKLIARLAPWEKIKRWEVELVHDESHYFQMVMANPVR